MLLRNVSALSETPATVPPANLFMFIEREMYNIYNRLLDETVSVKSFL